MLKRHSSHLPNACFRGRLLVVKEPRDALHACEELLKPSDASRVANPCLSYPFSSAESAEIPRELGLRAEGKPRCATPSGSGRFTIWNSRAGSKSVSGRVRTPYTSPCDSGISAESDSRSKMTVRNWHLALGYDTEHVPVPQQKSHIPTAPLRVLQLSSLHTCAVFLLGPLGGLPRCVASLLEDPGVLKVTQGAPLEIKQLRMEFGVHATAFFCLHTASSLLSRSPTSATNLAGERNHIFRKSRGLSLQALCQLYLGEVLPKNLQQSDWGSEPLSDEQILYAATDAHVSLRVFQAMTANIGHSNVNALMKLMDFKQCTS